MSNVSAVPTPRRRKAPEASPAVALRRSSRLSSRAPPDEQPATADPFVTTTTTTTAAAGENPVEPKHERMPRGWKSEMSSPAKPLGTDFAREATAATTAATSAATTTAASTATDVIEQASVLAAVEVGSLSAPVQEKQPRPMSAAADVRAELYRRGARAGKTGSVRRKSSHRRESGRDKSAARADSASAQVAPVTTTKIGAMVPRVLRFPVAFVMSMLINTALYTTLDRFGVFQDELARVSQQSSETWQVAVLFLWRIGELALGWVAGFDDFDMASITLLTHLPHLLFLNTFYRLSMPSFSAALLTDVISSALPFMIMRPRSEHHSFSGSSMPQIRRNVIADPSTAALTVFLASFIYAVSLVSAYRLPHLLPYLASSFTGLDTLQVAHEWAESTTGYGPRSLPALALLLLPLGFAARTYLFTPAATIPPSTATDGGRAGAPPFNARKATLAETIRHNLTPPAWMTDGRTAALSTRLALVLVLGLANAAVRTGGTIQGGEVAGGLAWGSVWAGANVLVAVAYWWVGHV